MKSIRGWTLAEVLVGIIVLLVGITFLVSASARAGRHGRLVECVNKLKQLHAGQEAYFAREGADALLRGDDLWLALTETDPPLLEDAALICPVSDRPKVYACHYLGPAADVTKMAPDANLACDDPVNHDIRGREGGNVLRMSGEVINASRDLWLEALRPGTGCTR